MNKLKLAFVILSFLFIPSSVFAQNKDLNGVIWIELVPKTDSEMSYENLNLWLKNVSENDPTVFYYEDENIYGERFLCGIRLINRKLAETIIIHFQKDEKLFQSISIELQNTADVRRFERRLRVYRSKLTRGKIRRKNKWVGMYGSLVHQIQNELDDKQNFAFYVYNDLVQDFWAVARITTKDGLAVDMFCDFTDIQTQAKRMRIGILITRQ